MCLLLLHGVHTSKSGPAGLSYAVSLDVQLVSAFSKNKLLMHNFIQPCIWSLGVVPHPEPELKATVEATVHVTPGFHLPVDGKWKEGTG